MSGVVPDDVLARLRAAPKYRGVHTGTITDVVTRAAQRATSQQELERRARRTLHRVTAGYLFTSRPSRLLRGLDEALATGRVRDWCRAVLSHHQTTAERLAELDRYYQVLFGLTGQPGSIADLACALNPFSLPWLRAATDARYTGYDLNLTFVDLDNAFVSRVDPGSEVVHDDVLLAPSSIEADVALLLKTYHNIEERQPGAGLRLVEAVAAAQVAVSLPVRPLSGRRVDFCRHHVDTILAAAGRHGWRVQRADLATEELLVVTKHG